MPKDFVCNRCFILKEATLIGHRNAHYDRCLSGHSKVYRKVSLLHGLSIVIQNQRIEIGLTISNHKQDKNIIYKNKRSVPDRKNYCR